MAVLDDIADELALRALALEFGTGDEGVVKRVSDALASSSPTMEETFLTAVRIRRAERRARLLLDSLENPEDVPEPEEPEEPDDGRAAAISIEPE